MEVKQCAELQEYNRLYKELDNLYYEISLKAGIACSAFWIMYTMVEIGDGCLQKDIAERYSYSRQTISSAVRSLEKKGYIILKHGKGRHMHLLFTPLGQEFVHKYIAPLMEMENRVFEIMPLQERQELLRLSRKYNEIFKQQVADILG